MSSCLGLIVRIASYIVDFAMGFFANAAWDKYKKSRRKDNASFINIQQSGTTSIIDMHFESKNAKAVESAAGLFTTYSNNQQNIPF